MNERTTKLPAIFCLLLMDFVLLAALAPAQGGAWLTHSHNEQHTALERGVCYPTLGRNS